MLATQNIGSQISFKGFDRAGDLADRQCGPTCGFEAIENVIQLFRPVDDTLTERDLIPRADHYGALVRSPMGYSLDVQAYQRILADYGITAQWYVFDHQHVIIPALRADRAVLVVGYAPLLDPQGYPNPSDVSHAFLLTNYYTDETDRWVLGYVGIDSNFPRQQRTWPCENVEAAAAWVRNNQSMPYPVLISDSPGNWPARARFYRLVQGGTLVPVP